MGIRDLFGSRGATGRHASRILQPGNLEVMERTIMVFPLIPILAVIAILGGGATLVWYDTLSDDEKNHANDWAAHYAEQLYHKTVAELTREEAQVVHRLTRGHFG
jgi:hypothetical protein